MQAKVVIGIDLDNTIALYDSVIANYLHVGNIALSDGVSTKRAARDYLRGLVDGEREWQRLQAYMYGPGMSEAKLAPGVDSFFTFCEAEKTPVYIISHKTDMAALAPEGPNLRAAALHWLAEQQLFGECCTWKQKVFFENSRRAKIERALNLGCTHFVDDLEETFRDAAFPATMVPLLYDRESTSLSRSGLRTFSNWVDIEHYFTMLLHA